MKSWEWRCQDKDMTEIEQLQEQVGELWHSLYEAQEREVSSNVLLDKSHHKYNELKSMYDMVALESKWLTSDLNEYWAQYKQTCEELRRVRNNTEAKWIDHIRWIRYFLIEQKWLFLVVTSYTWQSEVLSKGVRRLGDNLEDSFDGLKEMCGDDTEGAECSEGMSSIPKCEHLREETWDLGNLLQPEQREKPIRCVCPEERTSQGWGYVTIRFCKLTQLLEYVL